MYISSLRSSPSVVGFIRDQTRALVSHQKRHLKPTIKLNMATWGAVTKALGTAVFLLRAWNPLSTIWKWKLWDINLTTAAFKQKADLPYHRMKEIPKVLGFWRESNSIRSFCYVHPSPYSLFSVPMVGLSATTKRQRLCVPPFLSTCSRTNGLSF